MKIYSKIFLPTLLFLFFGLAIQAQNKKMEFSVTTGFVIGHEELRELSYGKFLGHLGFNLYNRKAKRFKTDFQVSVNFRDEKNTSSTLLSLNALYGGRYYFIGPEKPTTVFANALIGGVYTYESGDDFIENLFGFGYSAGCFIGIKRWIIGGAAESYNNLIIKIGYTF